MPPHNIVSVSFSPAISSRKIHSNLITHKFHMCRRTDSLEWMCNHKINTAVLSWSCRDRRAASGLSGWRTLPGHRRHPALWLQLPGCECLLSWSAHCRFILPRGPRPGLRCQEAVRCFPEEMQSDWLPSEPRTPRHQGFNDHDSSCINDQCAFIKVSFSGNAR